MLAAKYGHKEIVQLIINKLNYKDGGQDLRTEQIKVEFDVISRLNKISMNVNYQQYHDHRDARIADMTRRIKVMNLLLDKCADFNAKNDEGHTALMLAAANGHKDVVKLLIKKGADVSAKAYNGDTALDLALSHNKKDIAALLIENGATPKPEIFTLKNIAITLAVTVVAIGITAGILAALTAPFWILAPVAVGAALMAGTATVLITNKLKKNDIMKAGKVDRNQPLNTDNSKAPEPVNQPGVSQREKLENQAQQSPQNPGMNPK